MRIRRALMGVVCAAMAAVSSTGSPVTAAERSATVKLSDVALDLNISLDTTGARAIVAAEIKEDLPGANGVRPCRLIHTGPDKAAFDQFVRHIDPGALLVLVNLTGEAVTFTFGGQLFVEKGQSFTVESDEIKILTVRDDIEVPGDSPAAKLELDAVCFETLPGPIVPVP